MDHQKTGTLIATRRNELGLTQKELAKQLNISDRTVSKWERGAGFPDISLLEPLADALGLSVLELLHGERAPKPQPEAEQSAREAVQSLGSFVSTRLNRSKRWLRILSVLLFLAATFLVGLLIHSEQHSPITQEITTAVHATKLCPFILITTEEYELRDMLLADEAITSLLADGAILAVDESLSALYRDMVQINGSPPDAFRIEVIGHNLYVDFSLEQYRCILLFSETGMVQKTCAEFKKYGFGTPDPHYILLNEDNDLFYIASHS